MKKVFYLSAILGISIPCFSQNEFVDEFNDGIVNTAKYEAINASLIENANGMEVTPLTINEGGVRVKPELPNQGFGFDNPNATNSYEIIIRTEFTQPNETTIVEVVGTGGFIIESYIISNIDKNIYYVNRDKFGNLETELIGKFTEGEDIVIQRARQYSWWPPVCTGPICSYGAGPIPGGVVVVAKWNISKIANTQDNPPTVPSTINPINIVVKSTSKFTIAKFALRDFLPELQHPLLGLKPNTGFYRQNSGASLSLVIEQPFFNELTDITITVDNIPVNAIQVVSPTEISFTPPQNLSKGVKHIDFSGFNASENTIYEIIINESLRYHASQEPLILNDFDLSKSLLEKNKNYLIKLTSTGGGHQNEQYQLISGMLPTGMHLTPSGNIVGKPSETGVFGFFVKAYDNTGEEYTKLFFIEVKEEVSNRMALVPEDQQNRNTITLYPNPASDFIIINLG